MWLRQLQIALLSVVVLAVGGAATRSVGEYSDGTVAESQASPSPASTEEIARWITELSDGGFTVREQAMRRLIKAGIPAIPAVEEAARGRSLETGRRAVAILQAIYETSSTDDAISSAYDALSELARSGPESVSQQSTQVIRRNLFLEQQRAIVAIRTMRGQVHLEHVEPVNIDGEEFYPPNGWAKMVAIGEDWTGGTEGLREIIKLQHTVKTVYLLRGHPLQAEDIVNLEAELPNLITNGIQPRGDAFLGVQIAPSIRLGYGAEIEVKPNQPAERGGLQTGDVVVEIAGKAVSVPEDLIAIVSNFRPDDIVDIVVLRGDERDWYIMRDLMRDMLTQQGLTSPIVSIGLMHKLRTVKPVTLGRWSIDN